MSFDILALSHVADKLSSEWGGPCTRRLSRSLDNPSSEWFRAYTYVYLKLHPPLQAPSDAKNFLQATTYRDARNPQQGSCVS